MKFLVNISQKLLFLTGLVFLAWIYLGFCEKPLLVNPGGFSQVAYDDKGSILRVSLSSDERYRVWRSIDKISPAAAAAALEKEDRYFYMHPGVNPFSLLRAVFSTYVAKERRVGGSTISMQLARMRFGINSQNISGKIQQILQALLLERHYTKREILEAYLNLVPYGGNVEGIGAASLIYYGKPANELTLAEAVTLAVIPQSPSRRNPAKKDSYNSLQQARLSLVNNWIKETASENASRHRELMAVKTEFALPFKVNHRHELPNTAPHLVDRLFRKYPDVLEIHSTIDSELQHLLSGKVKQYTERRAVDGINNAAAMLLDFRSMQVKALVGSADHNKKSIHGAVDGTNAMRSPGSTLKPFIYALAFDQGVIHPKSILKDSPLSLASYNPENFDSDFLGPIDAHDALIRSRNVPAIRLANKINNPDLYSLLKQVGVRNLQSRSHYGLSVALGGVEVTMFDLVRLYAMLANDGLLQDITLIKGDAQTQSQSELQILSPEASRLVLDILEDNPKSGQALEKTWLKNPHKAAWKTGTSWGFRDAWSVGVFGPYVLAVWVGNFNGQANPAFVGRDAAAPLFFEILDAAANSSSFPNHFLAPRAYKIKKIKVCSSSGMLPNKNCPHLKETSFIPGVSPIASCNIHREVAIDKNTGLRLCSERGDFRPSGEVIQTVYEFWPSDLVQLFRTAGLPRRSPPSYEINCQSANNLKYGIAPKIVSPERKVQYNLRSKHSTKKIPFTAVSDSDSDYIFWFVDESFVGKADSGKTLFWEAKPGKYVVRVVDQFGQYSSQDLRVVLLD